MPSKTKIGYYVDVIQFAVLKFFTGTVAQPIRAFHIQVGHATVTAAMILGFSAMVIGLTWTYMLYELNLPREQARVMEVEANARKLQLMNAKMEQDLNLAPTLPWRILALNIDEDGVTLEFPVHDLSTQLIVSWKTLPTQPGPTSGAAHIRTGIISRDLTPLQGQLATILVEDVEFGLSWRMGNHLRLSMTQFLSDGRELRYSGPDRMILVP